MQRQLNEEDIWKAKDIYLYDGSTLYVVDENDRAYGYCQGSKEWFYKKNFWDYFDSGLMLAYFTIPTREEAVRLYRSWNG